MLSTASLKWETENLDNGRRKTCALELHDEEGLKKFFANPSFQKQAALRLIHVQNAPWATKYLMRKYNIDNRDEMTSTSFARWAKYDKPRMRAGKPVLRGKTFRTQRDPWRGISRTAYGLDYLRQYPAKFFSPSVDAPKMLELNHYDREENACYGYDVYVQRLSVYVQHNEDSPYVYADPDVKSPYEPSQWKDYQRLKNQYNLDGKVDGHGRRWFPQIEHLDNGSTIIVFETSQSESVDDTLVGARQEIESRWRRLTFYLPKDDVSDDEGVSLECMDLVLQDIFKALATAWEGFLSKCETHMSILEDKIYDSPADESRAPELWRNSNLWLKIEKLMYIHIDIIRELKNNLKELTDSEPQGEWLGNIPDEFDKLVNNVQEGLIKPTANLSDLMYKSVEIRDSRYSLQLETSMWRLSWITFIFLPLTFLSGFFGMNVDTFQNDPSLKWYFITAVPFMTIIIIVWYMVKHLLARNRLDPLRRGVFEHLYQELAEAHPQLWTRRGPNRQVVPTGLISAMKWKLVSYWYRPNKTINAPAYDPDTEGAGFWTRAKRWAVRHWLNSLTYEVLPGGDMGESSAHLALDEELGAVNELVQLSMTAPVAEAEPTAVAQLSPPLGAARSRSRSRGSGKSGSERPMSTGSSAVMIEEKLSDDGSGSENEAAREGLGINGKLDTPTPRL